MKNGSLKKIFPIIVVLLMILSWYTVLDGTVSQAQKYDKCVENAKSALKDDLPENAIENINAAMEIKPSSELVYMMADYYVKAEDFDSCQDWCESFFDTYKTESKIYEYLCKCYYMQGDYSNCISRIEMAVNGKLETKALKAYYQKVRLKYSVVADGFSYLSTQSNGYVKTVNNGKYGIMNVSGGSVLAAKYISVGGYSQTESHGMICPVIDEKGGIWFMDTSGNARVNVTAKLKTKTAFKTVSMICNGVFALSDTSGKYSLIRLSDYSVIYSGADFIGTCTANLIPVKQGDKWFFINNEGKPVTENVYDEIKTDDFSIAFRNDVAVVKQNGSYYMIDPSEKKLSEKGFSDICVFQSDGMTAVYNGKKWGFADNKGNVKFDEYNGAKPFRCGMGCFMKDGKWGFMDTKGNLIIENTFDDTNGFISDTTAVVAYGDSWSVIKFFRSSKLESALA